jgi:hypothetical protein
MLLDVFITLVPFVFVFWKSDKNIVCKYLSKYQQQIETKAFVLGWRCLVA